MQENISIPTPLETGEEVSEVKLFKRMRVKDPAPVPKGLRTFSARTEPKRNKRKTKR